MDDITFPPSAEEGLSSTGDEWLTPQEIALELKVNQQTIRNWLRDKTLVGAKFGDVWRVKRSEYDRFVAEAVRRGQRFELSDELNAFLKEHDYQAIHAFGDVEVVEFYVDLNHLDKTRNEFGMRSIKQKIRDNSTSPPFEGFTWIEDSENPFNDLRVEGASHSDVFLKLLRAIHDHDKRLAAVKTSLATDSKESGK